jgi:tRNA(fMet)-specific endonuclease VapC
LSLLLDTNVCVAYLNASSETLRRRYENALVEGEPFLIPSIVLFELWYGVEHSRQSFANKARLEHFLSLNIEVLSFSEEDARQAARIRATLEAAKQPIGHYDTLIAGQALARNLTLVTANTREFARVEGLKWQDWTSIP